MGSVWAIPNGDSEQGVAPPRVEYSGRDVGPSGNLSPGDVARRRFGVRGRPYSPAGTSEREWGFARGVGRYRFGKVVVWVVLAIIVLPVILSIALLLTRHQ
jgi:hypothetical protein